VKKAAGVHVVLVSAPDLKVARRLARGVLRGRLAACANVIPRIESHYWWKGKIERSGEVLLVFKTRAGLLAKLEEFIVKQHPYDTPEIVALELRAGNERYLKWLARETGQ
jgi:periplasmic divalent cation tolerance protein